MCENKVCEHCLIHFYIVGLYGNSRTYKCSKGVRLGYHDLSSDPCSGHRSCYKYDRRYSHSRGDFLYKLIPRKEMKKSEECLRQEEEDKESREAKAKKLEQEGIANLLEAKRLRED